MRQNNYYSQQNGYQKYSNQQFSQNNNKYQSVNLNKSTQKNSNYLASPSFSDNSLQEYYEPHILSTQQQQFIKSQPQQQHIINYQPKQIINNQPKLQNNFVHDPLTNVYDNRKLPQYTKTSYCKNQQAQDLFQNSVCSQYSNINNNEKQYNNDSMTNSHQLLQNEAKQQYDENEDSIKQSIHKLLNLIKSGLSQIKPNNKNIIIILGNTGSGKTSLAKYLSGIDLKVKKIDDYGITRFSFDGNINELESETYLPQQFSGQNIDIFDTPGFMDTRGEEIQIALPFFINKIISYAKSIKFILLIDGISLNGLDFGDSRGEGLKNIFSAYFSIVKDSISKISEFTSIGISKTIYDQSFYEQKIRSFFGLLTKSKDFHEQIKKQNCSTHQIQSFLQQMKNTQIFIFPSPCGNKEVNTIYDSEYRLNILDQLRLISFSHNIAFNFPVIKDMTIKIDYLWDYSQRMITEAFQKLGNSLEIIIKNLNLQQNNKISDLLRNSMTIEGVCDDDYINLINQTFIIPFQDISRIKSNTNQLLISNNPFDEFFKTIDFYLYDIHHIILRRLKKDEVFLTHKQARQFFQIMNNHILYYNQSMQNEQLKKDKHQQSEQLKSVLAVNKEYKNELENRKNSNERLEKMISQFTAENEELRSEIQHLKKMRSQNLTKSDDGNSQIPFSILMLILSGLGGKFFK